MHLSSEKSASKCAFQIINLHRYSVVGVGGIGRSERGRVARVEEKARAAAIAAAAEEDKRKERKRDEGTGARGRGGKR